MTHRVPILLSTVRVQVLEGDITMERGLLRKKIMAQAFDELCRVLNAPVGFMNLLPPTLSCQILNYLLRNSDGEAQLVISYDRIINIIQGETLCRQSGKTSIPS